MPKEYIGGSEHIRWANLGDENTKFFHAIATQVFRHNYITFLKSTDNLYVNDQDHKVAILWVSFKERIGTSVNTTHNFDISHLSMDNNLQDLDKPFCKEDIDDIIKHMPSDKSPSPYGFNAHFMEKCWHSQSLFLKFH